MCECVCTRAVRAPWLDARQASRLASQPAEYRPVRLRLGVRPPA
jgi:hypothetical protein